MAALSFTINGADYPVTDVSAFINSFSIDECGVFYEWTGVLIEDIADAPVTSRMIAAFMQIAYTRGNPGITAQAARQAVGQSNFAEAFRTFNAAQEEDARPPVPTPSGHEQNESPDDSNDSLTSSGTGSTPSTETPTNVHSLGGQVNWGLSATSGSTR